MDSTVIIVLAIILLALIILNNIIIVPSPAPIGGCAGTQFGCCPNGVDSKINYYGSNCPGYRPGPGYYPTPQPPPPQPYPPPPGGCAGTRYGCCPNSATPKFNQQGSNCPLPIPGGCAGTRYGCCPNRTTPKFNQQGSNCPNNPN